MSFYSLTTQGRYEQAYQLSADKPEVFWDAIARENFVWHKKWDQVLDADFAKGKFAWFTNAKLNITENCIDRHLEKKSNHTAIIFEPNNPKQPAEYISYKTLHEKVCSFANVLKAQGVQKGDRVVIYLPMIPELAYAVLACARIGAIHSVIFAGFSAGAVAARINDCEAKVVVTADGGYRGEKRIKLKPIIDEALRTCPSVQQVIVAQRTFDEVDFNAERDILLSDALKKVDHYCSPVSMDAEDPLFILYTSGSTGKPKGMLHTTAGYMVYAAFTFKNVFAYEPNDVYWCTADVGWITGHSYILYGPLANGATTLMFEGIPSYPDVGRFWSIVEKHKVNQFYTAPTAIRSLAKESVEYVQSYDLSSLKVLGTVGEPINDEAWQWYHHYIGRQQCPIMDTWWQTETGGIMISPLPGSKTILPTFATLPLPGVQPCILDAETKQELADNNVTGALCIKYPWPGMARSIWRDHQRFLDTYYNVFPGYYFTGDGAFRNADGLYRITGRIDDVIIVSGHNLGTAPIEDAIDEHELVAESAVVGYPHDIKGNALYGFVTIKNETTKTMDQLRQEINEQIARQIGPIAKLDKIQFVSGLPKTRSGKIMRRILRKIAQGNQYELGDVSTLLNPECIPDIIQHRI